MLTIESEIFLDLSRILGNSPRVFINGNATTGEHILPNWIPNNQIDIYANYNCVFAATIAFLVSISVSGNYVCNKKSCISVSKNLVSTSKNQKSNKYNCF